MLKKKKKSVCSIKCSLYKPENGGGLELMFSGTQERLSAA